MIVSMEMYNVVYRCDRIPCRGQTDAEIECAPNRHLSKNRMLVKQTEGSLKQRSVYIK